MSVIETMIEREGLIDGEEGERERIRKKFRDRNRKKNPANVVRER